jgi:hypothetical protein
VRALISLWRLWGRVLGGRKIAAALWASATAASTAPAEASSTAAIAPAVAPEILSPAIIAVAAWTRVFLRGIVLAKILRSGGVRFRLALFRFAMERAIFIGLAFEVSFHGRRRLMFVLV